MPLNSFAQKSLMDLQFGGASYTPPATYYAALFVGSTEVSASGYARVAVTNNGTNFPAVAEADPYTIVTGTDITFPTPGASWGTPDNVRLFDANTAGQEHAQAAIGTPIAIVSGALVKLVAGDLSFTMQGA